MKKYKNGILIGSVIGIINCIFLVFAKDLGIEVYIGTFLTWLVTGTLVSAVDFNTSLIIKGMIVAIIVYLPNIAYVVSSSAFGAIWNAVTTLFFGAILGLILDKMNK